MRYVEHLFFCTTPLLWPNFPVENNSATFLCDFTGKSGQKLIIFSKVIFIIVLLINSKCLRKSEKFNLLNKKIVISCHYFIY